METPIVWKQKSLKSRWYHGLVIVSAQNSYVEALSPSVIGPGDGDFGR